MADGNPDIVKAAEGYRFGDPNGPDPAEAGRKGGQQKASIRAAVRRIAAAEFDIGEDAPPMKTQINRVFGGENKMTGAQMAGARKFALAMNDLRGLENLTNDVDGKLVEKRVEAKTSLEDLVNGIESDQGGEGED